MEQPRCRCISRHIPTAHIAHALVQISALAGWREKIICIEPIFLRDEIRLQPENLSFGDYGFAFRFEAQGH